MDLPKKPTTRSWVKDAEALLEMGARSIDAATVRGLLEEIDRLKAENEKLKGKK